MVQFLPIKVVAVLYVLFGRAMPAQEHSQAAM
jgi:hypothetical protein